MRGKDAWEARVTHGICTTKWNWLVAGVGAALFSLRVSLEATSPHPLRGVAFALLCTAIAYAGRAAPQSWRPLWVCWLYVAWPQSSPSLAFSVGFLALVGLLIQNLKGRQYPILVIDGLVFLAALAIYVSTLAPTILPADSGEFQIVGPLLGVAHPPGYALFTVLAKLFSLLPFGQIPWRLNLMGAVIGSLTLTVVSRTARKIAGSPWAGIAAAGALGVSTTFWAQSTTINIRALTVLFTVLSCHFLIGFILAPVGSKQGVQALNGLAVSFGLGVSHHASLAFFVPVFGLPILWHDPGLVKRLRVWSRCLLVSLLPFLANVYIVVRAITGASFGTDELVDAGRVIDHLLGRGFGGDMFAFLRLDRVLWERFLVVGNILHFQFGGPLLVISAVGFAWLAWQRRRIAALLGGMLAVMVFVVATYRAPQSVEYLMPAYVPLVLGVGSAVALATELSSRLGAQGRFPAWQEPAAQPPNYPATQLVDSLLIAAILLPIFSLGHAHLPSYVQLHNDRSAREYAESVLLHAPQNAHILSNWHWYTPLLYLQLVEGKRADVEVTYVYPQGATDMPQAWALRIVRELESSDRPLIVTDYYHTYGDLPYRFAPLGEAFLVHAGPSWDVPADLERIDADFAEHRQQQDGIHPPKIRILGYRIDPHDAVHPGDWVTVDLFWQPLVRLTRGYSFFVHLIGANNVPLGQRDRRHDAASTYQPGQVLADRYEVPVFLTAAPATYTLTAGVYFVDDGSWQRLTTGDGSDPVPLATLSVVPSPLPPVTLRPLYTPFVDGPTLVGVDYDDTLPEQRRVYLHWLACDQAVVARLYAGGRLIAQVQVPGGAGNGYVTTVLDVPPGADGLGVDVLRIDDQATLPSRSAWGIARTGVVRLPRTQPRHHYLPFGGKVALVGVSAGNAWHGGDRARVAVRFLGLRSIVHDYVVSVGVRGGEVTAINSDGVPALGAIPTFKWVRGSQVTDVHLIEIPADASDKVELTLGLYDAFTTHALPPLDERVARLGRASVLLKWVSIRQ